MNTSTKIKMTHVKATKTFVMETQDGQRVRKDSVDDNDNPIVMAFEKKIWEQMLKYPHTKHEWKYVEDIPEPLVGDVLVATKTGGTECRIYKDLLALQLDLDAKREALIKKDEMLGKVLDAKKAGVKELLGAFNTKKEMAAFMISKGLSPNTALTMADDANLGAVYDHYDGDMDLFKKEWSESLKSTEA